MSDENLEPWLQSGAPDGVARLLESAGDDSPSPMALGKLAAKLATAGLLTPGGGGGGGGGDGGGGATHAPSHPAPASHVAQAAHHAAAAAKPLALGAKAALWGSLGVAALGGGAFQAGRLVERHAQEQQRAVVAAAPLPAVLPPAEVTPPPPPAEEPAPAPEPPKVSPRPAPKPVETASPDQEAQVLTEAMKASQELRWADALAAAEQHARRFPHGALAQEREMIAIEALLNLSRRPDAERRAAKFKKQWPTSTHLVRLNTLLHGP